MKYMLYPFNPKTSDSETKDRSNFTIPNFLKYTLWSLPLISTLTLGSLSETLAAQSYKSTQANTNENPTKILIASSEFEVSTAINYYRNNPEQFRLENRLPDVKWLYLLSDIPFRFSGMSTAQKKDIVSRLYQEDPDYYGQISRYLLNLPEWEQGKSYKNFKSIIDPLLRAGKLGGLQVSTTQSDLAEFLELLREYSK